MNAVHMLDCVYIFLTIVFFGYTCCKIFYNDMFHRVWNIICGILGACENYFWSFSTIAATWIPASHTRQTLRSLCSVTILFFFVMLFRKIPMKRRLQVYGVLSVAIFIAEVIMTFLYVVVWDVSADKARIMDFTQRLFSINTSLLLYIIFLSIAYWFCKKTKPRQSSRTIFVMLLLLFCFFFMTTTTIAILYNSSSLFSKYITLFLFALSGLALATTIYISKSLDEKELLAERLEHVQEIQNLESDYYLEIQKKSDDIRAIRHDINDQLQAVKIMLQNQSEGSLDLAKNMIDSLDERITATTLPIYTENSAINAIVCAKAKAAEEKGIYLNIFINLPTTIPNLETYDLNLLFINLLNNAIFAAADLPSTAKKEITVKASIFNDNLTIKVVNPYTAIKRSKSGQLQTTKKDPANHGLGLLIIEKVVNKYGGTFLTDQKNKLFEALVSISLSRSPQ